MLFTRQPTLLGWYFNNFINRLYEAFRKAGKSGNAGPAFGAAVAAGAGAVIDFVANWLLNKIKGAASKVGEKIKSIAQKILARLKKVGSKVVGAVKRGAGTVLHALGNTRVGQAVKRGYETVRNTVNKGKARIEQWQKDRAAKKNVGKTPEEIAKEKQDKLDKAVAAIRPTLLGMLQKGSSALVLNARLAFWRMRYGLASLSVVGGDSFQIIAKVNPEREVVPGVVMHPEELLLYIRKVTEELLSQDSVREGAERIEQTHTVQPPPANSKRKSDTHDVTVDSDVSMSSVTAWALKQKPRTLTPSFHVRSVARCPIALQMQIDAHESRLLNALLGGVTQQARTANIPLHRRALCH